jgi:hypothetical protein
MSPPLLLPVAPMANLNSEKEEEEWANIVKDKGYHDQQAITRYVAWDMRQEFSRKQQGGEQQQFVEQQQGIEQQQVMSKENIEQQQGTQQQQQ